jgi:hypothetical protein
VKVTGLGSYLAVGRSAFRHFTVGVLLGWPNG